MKRKKNCIFRFSLPGLLFILFVAYSCSSSRNSSVREIKDSRQSRVEKISKNEAMVKPLFMQYKRVTVELPNSGVHSENGGTSLSEIVTYTNPSNSNIDSKNRLDTTKIYELNEFVIAARSTFTPERDGRVKIDFNIKVPQEYLSPNWCLTLTPVLFHNDSIVELEDVLLKGENFYAKQKHDYQSFDDYVNSIVDKADYDSVFSDTKNISRDIKNRQEFYWKLYNEEWNRQKNFEEWKKQMEEQEARQAARRLGQREKLKNEYIRKAREKSIQEFARGKDTTGIYAEHMRQFEKKAKDLPKEWEKEDLKSVPNRYRDMFEDGKTIEDLSNYTMTEKDSVEIAKNRYMFDKIADNELKAARIDEKKEELIPFPFREDVRLDSVVYSGNDLVYHYSQSYPVTEGLKNIGISVQGRVQAMDHSTFALPGTDTIRYYISSLAQLADTTLVYRQTKVYRNMYEKKVIYPKFSPGKSAFNINFEDNRAQMDALMDNYFSLLEKHKGVAMDSVTVHTTTSLDGTFDTNALLSQERGEALKSYLSKTYGGRIDVESVFKTTYAGEDWNTLVSLLKKRTDVAHKQEILNLIGQAVYPDDTEEQIKKLHRSDYKIIYDSIYPLLKKMDITYHLGRPGMAESDSIHSEEKEGYEEGLRLLLNREYSKAFDILIKYPDYNTALCLVCAGYNDRAYNLLVQLKPSGNSEYLMAIVCKRIGQEEEAVQHLQRSFELDPHKKDRARLDPEVSELIARYGINLSQDF